MCMSGYTYLSNFLCIKVQEAMMKDICKLRRVLGYLKATEECVLLLNFQNMHAIKVYIDVVFFCTQGFQVS